MLRFREPLVCRPLLTTSIAGSLYENPTPRHLHVPGNPYNLGMFCADCGHELDSRKYQGCLLRVCSLEACQRTTPEVLTRFRDQPAHFSCPNGRTFFSSSIVWGENGLYFGIIAIVLIFYQESLDQTVSLVPVQSILQSNGFGCSVLCYQLHSTS